MTALAIPGLVPLYGRRLSIALKTAAGMVGQIVTPILWVLIVAPALDVALGDFRSDVDYFTYVAVAQVAFLVPFTAMFMGLQVIVDRSGNLPELLVAPVRRAAIPLANAAAVLTIALVQVGIIVVLAGLRGAEFDTSATGVLWFAAGVSLLLLAVYGIAEILATAIGRQEAYGPLIPAIGVTPWFLSGSLFPLSVLPAGVEQLGLALPWTHALALMRYGLMEGSPSGLEDIWQMGSEPLMAALSLLVLCAFAGASLAAAVRVFNRRTTL